MSLALPSPPSTHSGRSLVNLTSTNGDGRKYLVRVSEYGSSFECYAITQESVTWKTLRPYSMRVSEPFLSPKLPIIE